MRRRLAAFLVALSPALAEASVPDSYGFGSRSTAMAGAVCADASDFSAGYYNPAGLAEAPGIEIAVGYMYNAQRLTMNGRDNGVDDVHGLVGGLVAPGKIFGVPFAFGIGVHLPDDGISFIKARRQGVPRWELYDTRAQLMYLEAALAIRPFEFLEIGGGLAYLSATRGRFGIRGRAEVLRPFDSELEHEVDADLTAVRFPQVGLRLLWEGWGNLGVTYRGQSNLDLELDALLEGVVDFAGIEIPLLYQLEARTIASFTPQQVAVGLSVTKIPRFRLNLDVTWVNWSAYESPTAQIAALLEVDPPPGTPINLPDSPAPVVIVPPAFEDRVVPRFGVEYSGVSIGSPRTVHGVEAPLLELPLRVGYVYEQSPVPPQRGVNNLVDTDRHTVTLGFGLTLNAPAEEMPGSLHLDAHGLFSIFPERSMLKDNPADFVGDYRASGHIFGGGGTLRAVF
jgi:hypothetical protein